MKLREIALFLGLNDANVPDIQVKDIRYDSRQVQPEDLFVALSGTKADGHLFLEAACERGASALLVEHLDCAVPAGVGVLVCPDTRLALARLAAMWHDFPDRGMRVIGVTGTNGKTTTTNLIKNLLEAAGKKVGLVGTIQNMIGNKILPAAQTTPEPLALTELIAQMRDAGCAYVVMEVSSHSLKQQRVAGLHFDTAVFTNLTQDHLDFHGTLEDYLASKALLFGMLGNERGQNRYGVVNIDDGSSATFQAASAQPIITYGVDKAATLQAVDLVVDARGTHFTLLYQGKSYAVKLPLSGKFNVYNALAAMAVGLGEGLSLDFICATLQHAPQVAGRFEKVDCGQDFAVIVDYAHTPDGLENVLSTARGIVGQGGRLLTVFGCGGDRDRTKRPIMGGIAGKYSDFSVVTSDNPRTEVPAAIIAEVEVGIKQVTDQYIVRENRHEAIRQAIEMAKSGDVVVIAGKGHEDYQLVQGQVLHFDDREEARLVLADLQK